MAKFSLTLSLIFYISFVTGKPNFSVKVDHRMEAISILYALATLDTLDTKPTPSTYYKDFKENFSKCKNHPSIRWYRNLDK